MEYHNDIQGQQMVKGVTIKLVVSHTLVVETSSHKI